jgi:hypothetical protein
MAAPRTGDLDMLQWAVENGCPWNRDISLARAIHHGHTEMVKWIENYQEEEV